MSESETEEPSCKKARTCTINTLKREVTSDETVEKIKRLRVSEEQEKDAAKMEIDTEESDKVAAQRRNYFLTACELVSYDNFSNHKKRFLLTYPPSCSLEECDHKTRKESCLEIASYAKETFRIDFKAQMWCEALHVCEMMVSPDTHLPAEMMLDIVEIMMNVHPDTYAGYSVEFILDRCLQTLYLTYRTHPPCGPAIRKCYKQFLTSPLNVKDGTLSNRLQYECEKGIVKYCLNRLGAELNFDAKDDPLVNKSDHITEEMKQSIRGLHWQKEKLDILETMDRNERIKRLLVVLKCVVELLTADLSIWLSRHIHNQGTHIMRSHRPLLSIVLWSNKILYTGAVNNNCRQIISLFVDFVHLGFPENDIEIITQLMNAMIQTFYMCENNSDGDFPHTGKYCDKFASEVVIKIKDLCMASKTRVISRIKPSFMRHLVAMNCVNSVLQSEESDALKALMNFLRNETWTEFKSQKKTDNFDKNKFELARKSQRIYAGFSKILRSMRSESKQNEFSVEYPKHGNKLVETDNYISLEEILELLLVALDAFFDCFGIDKLQRFLANPDMSSNDENQKKTSYSLSEDFYKKYRGICKDINEIKTVADNVNIGSMLKRYKGHACLNIIGLC